MAPTLKTAVGDLVLEHGPLTLEQLHALAVERRLTTIKTPSAMRRHADEAGCIVRPDGRYDSPARLLRGQVFTTRPRPGAHDGVLWTYRDLDPLTALPRLPLRVGGEVRRGEMPVECWTGPSGWLPDLEPGGLVAFCWDGTALEISAAQGVVAGDSERVRDVREVLSRHARTEHRYGWSSAPRTSLTRTVLSALVEDPGLFVEPLPPLRELLPLPEDLRPQDTHPGGGQHLLARIVEVPLGLRVHDELARRADLLGERLPDYLSMVLAAAADRVQLQPRRYDGYEPYDGSAVPVGGAVVELDRWSR